MSVLVEESDRRFVVTSVTGYTIDPATASERTKSPHRHGVPVSYYVLDRFDSYRVVGDFTATDGHRTNAWRRASAYWLADQLNAWHDREGWQDVEPMEVIA